MVFYKCGKCNKEFHQKSNYLSHINRKKSCIVNENTNNNTNEDNLNNNTNKDNVNNTNIIKYKCEKCNKEFYQKCNYLLHINKKNPCNSKDLINENKILLDKIKELENKLKENNKELENKNKELNTENNIFKGENNTLKELLNNKDIEIKDLYKNIYNKTKDNDIKIKKIQEYVYIIRECDFVRLNENIYKIGRTSKVNPDDRFQKYRSKANYENEVFIISRYRNSRFFWC
jgi:DNA-directed RNA polymerase subunit RPC12/RpoP